MMIFGGSDLPFFLVLGAAVFKFVRFSFPFEEKGGCDMAPDIPDLISFQSLLGIYTQPPHLHYYYIYYHIRALGVAQVVMELLQRFDQQIIYGEANRSTPVVIAVKHSGTGLYRFVIHPILLFIYR